MMGSRYLVTGAGALGVAGLGGTSVYMYGFRGDILETKVRNYFKDQTYMKTLNSSTQEEWVKFKEFYAHSTDEKPKGIDKEQIAKWCEDKLASRDDSSFELVKKWCVIDSREVQVKAISEGRKIIPVTGEKVDQAWQSAWNRYSSGEAAARLRIQDPTFASGSQYDGASDLKQWCQSKASKSMYEYLGESSGYEKYHAWCTKE
ncbi:hypothetical protein MHC_02055 [Mycoplasma haemocanis str. Illinois]|uniref:Uncharacterized protein n=1 Tax=Mycoplasma haemocanis (strain Illinois) TaxID=1111676 RepID=H6N6K5_MYCHN|nr:hypothetical protein [Mycoplasma haemocanis]AEW45277.1 hypothetical protein MHC_02055 [Mycoplasma haemocanis str. Illinois]